MYLIFSGYHCYPVGGPSDLVYDHETNINLLKKVGIKEFVKLFFDTDDCEWIKILNTETMKYESFELGENGVRHSLFCVTEGRCLEEYDLWTKGELNCI